MTETHFDANAASNSDKTCFRTKRMPSSQHHVASEKRPILLRPLKQFWAAAADWLSPELANPATLAESLRQLLLQQALRHFSWHAGEAAHGDLGMITSEDIVLGISYSGETQELLMIVPILKREGAILIAMTGNPESTLAQHADLHINCHVDREACPLNLAPTSSTTTTLALGDALAVAACPPKVSVRKILPVAIRAEHSGADCSSMCGTLCAQETNASRDG